jgi:hypothetical protein
LEGLLRRKSPTYVDKSGLVTAQFTVTDSSNQSQVYGSNNRRRLNRINDSLRLFEQHTIPGRQRLCTGLTEAKQEIQRLYGATVDIYDLVDSWRNELIHGNQYWMDRLPIILNLICLMVIDEIEPVADDRELSRIQRRVAWTRQTQSLTSFRAPWEVYPPDL